MKKFFIENWFKLIVSAAILAAGISATYYCLICLSASIRSNTIVATPSPQNESPTNAVAVAISTSTPPTTTTSTSSSTKSIITPASKKKTAPPAAPALLQAQGQNTNSGSSGGQTQAAPSSSPVTTATPITSQDNPDPPERAIDSQTLVGILCYYNMTYTGRNIGGNAPSSQQLEVRGSGVIINSRGDILTNRHVIEQPTSYASITDNNGNTIPVTADYELDRCDVGQLPADSQLPTITEIQTINPYVQIPVLGYTAQLAYVSPTSGLSATEIQSADFAILQITGISQSGRTFGITSIPNSFPYAKLLPIKQYPKINGPVVTYGFPGNVTSGQGNFFQTLTMTGSVGHVTGVNFGDSFYADTPLTIQTDMEVAYGRSGSPLFWRGYVIGLVTYFIGNNRTDSGSVASDAILKGLEYANYWLGG